MNNVRAQWRTARRADEIMNLIKRRCLQGNFVRPPDAREVRAVFQGLKSLAT